MENPVAFSFHPVPVPSLAFKTLKLLEMQLLLKNSTLMRLENEEALEKFDNWLWTYNQDSFIAHGTAKDRFPERQPIYLTCNMEIPNQATTLILMNRTEHPVADLKSFQEVRVIFDDNKKQAAREFWAECVRAGYNPQMST